MEYRDFRVRYEECRRDFIEAFVMVLGEKYRSQITRNLNRVVFLDFITKDQFENYFEKRSISKESSNDLMRDMETEKEIRRKYYHDYLDKIMKLIPQHPVLLAEEEKVILDPNYETPLFNPSLGKEKDKMVKFFILEKLGHTLEVEKPYGSHKEENDKLVEQEWGMLFASSETSLMGEVSSRMFRDMEYEVLYHTGTIMENQHAFEKENTLINGSFDYRKVLQNPKARYAVFNVDSTKGEILPIFVFSPLSIINEAMLFSFVVELTKVISMNLLRFDDKISIKMGVMELNFTRGVDIYDDEELLKDRPEVVWEFEKRNAFNDAITQYISNLVCHVIIENGLCKNLFPFPIPEQKGKFDGNLMLCFKEFLERHFSSIKRCYMGEILYEKIGNVSFDELVAIANVVLGNRELALRKKEFLVKN